METRTEFRSRVHIAMQTILVSATLRRCVGNQEPHAARHHPTT